MRNSLLFLNIVMVLALSALGCGQSEPERPAGMPTASPPPAHGTSSPPKPARPLPPYHDSPEVAKPFPRLVPASRYRDYPVVARAYEIANRIPEVIAQQPCFCYCDKFGHRSLLDCYASDHGAG